MDDGCKQEVWRLVAQPPSSVDGTARFWGYVFNRGSNLCSRGDPRGGRPRALVQNSVARSPATARYHFRCVRGGPGLDRQRKGQGGNRSRGERTEKRRNSRCHLSERV